MQRKVVQRLEELGLRRSMTAVIKLDGNRLDSSCRHLWPQLFQKQKR
jgi:hypothetical protein